MSSFGKLTDWLFHTKSLTKHSLNLKKLLIEKFRKVPKMKHPLMGEDTFNLGILNGGLKVNMVPEQCEAHLDLRMCSPAETESSLRQLNEIIKRLEAEDPNFKVGEVEVYERQDPVEIDFSHPLIEKIKSCIHHVTGKDSFLKGTLSAGDQYYTLKARVPFPKPCEADIWKQLGRGECRRRDLST